MIDKALKKEILKAQRNEITEYHLYKKLALSIKDKRNQDVLRNIAKDELRHYEFWKKFSNEDVEPSNFKIWLYYTLSKLFGVTFGVKLMEKGEELAQKRYDKISRSIPEAKELEKEEKEHEQKIITLLSEERISYIGSIVLGLNDALVELTGALAGLTFALQNTRLIAIVGFITGMAASLSMAASEFLSIQSEQTAHNPVRAAVYTGIAYFITVLFLIFPYFIFENPYGSLGFTLINALIVILIFTTYSSIVQDVSFKKRFFQMVSLSFGIAAFTFLVGFLIRIYFGVEA